MTCKQLIRLESVGSEDVGSRVPGAGSEMAAAAVVIWKQATALEQARTMNPVYFEWSPRRPRFDSYCPLRPRRH